MRLLKVRITNYRSIDDSGWVECKENVLCLVGKNESGKTSFLVALEKLSPVEASRAKFNLEKDYPRKGLNAYKKRHEKEPANVIDAVFAMDEDDCIGLNETLGEGVLKPQEVRLTKGYDNHHRVGVVFDEAAAVRLAATNVKPPELLAKLAAHPTLAELEKAAGSDSTLAPLLAHLKAAFPQGVVAKVRDAVWNETPDFLYFDDYSVMRGRVGLPHIQRVAGTKEAPPVDRADRTFLALLNLAGTTAAELVKSRSNTEALTANLEAAAIDITKEVFEFWTQNTSLRVQFQVLEADDEDRAASREGPVFHTRIWNDRHQMTVSFDERSRGFVWFFSFLAYFSSVKDHPRPVVLLLDEPGLSLHAMAQNDFLRFIEKRLAKDHQVIYTTHSPFMVDPNEPARIRLVEDKTEKGTVVSSDFIRSRHGDDTLYPLMAALGIQMSQTLFVGPNTLLVEGPSEFLYFPAMSKILADAKRTGLDPRWTIAPTNGVDKVSAFVALFGANRLNLAVVMDYEPKKKKLLDSLRAEKRLGAARVVPVTEVVGSDAADIEDLFAPQDYLNIVNQAYDRRLPANVTVEGLGAGERIVKRLEHHFEAEAIEDGRFGHAFVAESFARRPPDAMGLDPITLDRFEALFKKLNAILKTTLTVDATKAS